MPTQAADVYEIDPPPDPSTESVVPYYGFVPELLARHQGGAAPSRTSLSKYLARGFPVARGGPYVRMPVFRRLKRVYTTEESMARWLTVVRQIEDELGIVTA